jgi:uncharacterized protein YndB with AHSA1/START domain
MHTIDVHHDIQAPLERVWRYLEDFADIQAWWPTDRAVGIERVELEGEGVGQIRHIYSVGFPNAVSERLDFLDSASHTLKLSIVGRRPAGLLEYRATGRLTALGPGACRMTYHSEFATREGRAETAKAFLLGLYQLMFRGLEAAAKRQQP